MPVKTKTGVWLDTPAQWDGFEASRMRAQCGLSQAEMAFQMGMSERAYHTAERMGRAYHFQSIPARSRLDFMEQQCKDADERERRQGGR